MTKLAKRRLPSDEKVNGPGAMGSLNDCTVFPVAASNKRKGWGELVAAAMVLPSGLKVIPALQLSKSFATCSLFSQRSLRLATSKTQMQVRWTTTPKLLPSGLK